MAAISSHLICCLPPTTTTLSFPPLRVHKAISRRNKSGSKGLLWKLASLIESNGARTQRGRKEKVSRLRTFNEYWIKHQHHSIYPTTPHTHTHTSENTFRLQRYPNMINKYTQSSHSDDPRRMAEPDLIFSASHLFAVKNFKKKKAQ